MALCRGGRVPPFSVRKITSMDESIAQLNGKKIPSFEVISKEFHGDCDIIVQDGLFNQVVTPDCQNGPGFYAYILVLRYPSGNVTQIAFGYNSKNFAMRYKYAGNWVAWRQF